MGKSTGSSGGESADVTRSSGAKGAERAGGMVGGRKCSIYVGAECMCATVGVGKADSCMTGSYGTCWMVESNEVMIESVECGGRSWTGVADGSSMEGSICAGTAV